MRMIYCDKYINLLVIDKDKNAGTARVIAQLQIQTNNKEVYRPRL